MGSTFIALPLTSGEAFLLRTADDAGREWTILVDSGKKYGQNSRELAKVLDKVKPKIEHIDIAVCTHSDADHSQGFWHFPDDWYDMGRTIGEFWLPGRWANAMPAILTDPTGLVAKLSQGAIEASAILNSDERPDILKGMSRESRYSSLGRATSDRAEMGISGVVPASQNSLEGDSLLAAGFGLSTDELNMLRSDLEETDERIDAFEEAASVTKTPRSWLLGVLRLEGASASYSKNVRIQAEAGAGFAEVADTATAIRKIATAALSRKIRVRWFDFGEYEKTDKPAGGIEGLLEPFCSVEVFPDPMGAKRLTALQLFSLLRLSRQNVESLVFYRPETDDAPGVLFLGDSRLAHGIERPEKNFPVPFNNPARKLLVTAPHHGSDNNDRAFEVLDAWLGNDGAHYVRNGGQSNQRLGDYLDRSERRCAQCVQCNGKDWNQWVAVMSSGNSWNWPPTAQVCGTPKR